MLMNVSTAPKVDLNAPLAGLVVIDAASVIAGPMVATLLGDYGARVIKVEEPENGDNARGGLGPNKSLWRFYGRNKECVTCNLATPEGAELFRSLAAKADVVIEGFKAGKMESWGLSYEELSRDNPGLVMLRISGFGQTGPYAARPGYGTLAESYGGLPYVTGSPDGSPTLPGAPVADVMAGFAGASAVMMALWSLKDKPRTTKGYEIDLSLYAPMLYEFGPNIIECDLVGEALERRGNQLAWIPSTKRPKGPRDIARCRDGKWVAYSVVSPNLRLRLAEFLQRSMPPQDGAAPDAKALAADGEQLNNVLIEFISMHDRDDILARLIRENLPIAPVYSGTDILDDPHFAARGEFVTVDEGTGRPYRMPRGPFRMNGFGGELQRVAGDLGADNDAVYKEFLDLDDESISSLRSRRII